MKTDPKLTSGMNVLVDQVLPDGGLCTMYVRDHQRPAFHEALGVDPDWYAHEVFTKTSEITKQIFPITLDIDHPRWQPGLKRCRRPMPICRGQGRPATSSSGSASLGAGARGLRSASTPSRPSSRRARQHPAGACLLMFDSPWIAALGPVSLVVFHRGDPDGRCGAPTGRRAARVWAVLWPAVPGAGRGRGFSTARSGHGGGVYLGFLSALALLGLDRAGLPDRRGHRANRTDPPGVPEWERFIRAWGTVAYHEMLLAGRC
jgi:hypothetical protein